MIRNPISGRNFEEFIRASSALDLKNLETSLLQPLPVLGFTAQSASEALEQAQQLAEAAYLEKNPDAESHAEKILYLIHSLNHFAPPLQELPAILWGTLSRAKVVDAMEKQQSIQPASREMTKSILEGLVLEAEEKDHPILDEICSLPDPKGISIYAKNWIITAQGFINQLASLFQRSPRNLKKVVRENMEDEFKGTEHAVLRDRFLQSVGVHYSPQEALKDPEYLSESMSVLNLRTLLTTLSNPYFAFGSFYSIEGVFYQVSRRLTQGLRKRGLPEDSFEMFTVHSEVDEDHASEWLEGIDKANLTDAERGCVVAGARAQMRTRHRHYEAMKALIQRS